MARDGGLHELNAAQREAVLHGVPESGPAVPAPPLLVIAGAGTGKTATLAHRVAQLVLKGADPTGSSCSPSPGGRPRPWSAGPSASAPRRWAARRRVAGRLAWAGTFHAIGARLLREHADAIGLDPGFTILDRADAADLLDLVRDELRLAGGERRFPQKGTCLAVYSHAVNAQAPLEAVLRDVFPWCGEWAGELRRLFAAYVGAKQGQGVLDYDDLLLWWERMLRVPELARAVGGRFDHLLVDEYQDTNALQAAILRHLKPDGRGVTVVGDDAQAIYGFRAATVRNILDFPGRFTPPARVVTLERNYRSTRPILDAANAVIGLAREGYRKELSSTRRGGQRPALVLVRDDLAQAGHVARQVLANREAGLPLKDQAVLFRAAGHGAALELELARRNIPYVKHGGLRFFEAAHVKDVLAILRWAENPRDRVAAFRALQLLPGVGPGTARRTLDAAGGRLPGPGDMRPPPAAAEHWPRLAALLADLRAAPWPVQLGLVRAFYDPLLEELHDFAATRRADLDQLERLAATAGSRERFLTELTLDPPAASGGPAGPPLRDEDHLVLSTIHSAKGQEWKAVFVLNLVDGCVPSDMATNRPAGVEEERRLLYVAMTRARDQLQLLQPERFYATGQARHGDRYVRAPRSRFLPDGLLHLFEHVAVAAPHPGAPVAAPVAVPGVDLAAAVRSMWE